MKWSQICRMVPQRGLAKGNEIPYQISQIRERVLGKNVNSYIKHKKIRVCYVCADACVCART